MKTKKKLNASAGMTLVELVVFMTLTLSLMASTIPMIYQAQVLEAMAEEKLAAFFACKGVLSELYNTEFEELAAAAAFQEVSTGVYESTSTNIPFHSKSGIQTTTLTATEHVTLEFGQTGQTSNCYTSVTLEWSSYRGHASGPVFSETVSTILYP